MSGFPPFSDPALDVDIDAVRLGMLTFRGVVKDSMQRKRKILFTCDCGRVVIIPIPSLKVYETTGRHKLDGIPWSCGECGAREVGPKRKPWGLKYSTTEWKVHPRRKSLRTRQKKALRQNAKELHRPEWFAWQQAKRLGRGVVARWKRFDLFYKDMGDRPAGARMAKKERHKPHGPDNSYWEVPKQMHWGDQPVTVKWVVDRFQIPRDYVFRCKRAGILNVQTVIAMHQSGLPPKKLLTK